MTMMKLHSNSTTKTFSLAQKHHKCTYLTVFNLQASPWNNYVATGNAKFMKSDCISIIDLSETKGCSSLSSNYHDDLSLNKQHQSYCKLASTQKRQNSK